MGELGPEAQAMLLRVLETGEFERVGGTETLRSNARVVAATNRDLAACDARFRRDLYFRLAVFEVVLPPLRERREDIPELARAMAERHARRLGLEPPVLGPRLLAALEAHSWPGNVRELVNALERAVILGCGSAPLDDPELLALPRPASPLAAPVSPSPAPAAPPPHAPAAAAAPAPAQQEGVPTELEEVERRHIRAVLERTDWLVAGPRGAARLLGLKPSTLRSRIKKLGIGREGHR